MTSKQRPMPQRPMPAPILRGAVYPKQLLMQIVGWGNSAYAAAQKAGLVTTVLHGRALISGDDFCDYVERIAREKSGAKAAPEHVASRPGCVEESDDPEPRL